MEDQRMVIVKSVDAWARQAREALDKIRQANGGQDPSNLDAAEKIDFAAFASLVEAMVALEPATGRKVSQDLIRKAGLRPVDELI